MPTGELRDFVPEDEEKPPVVLYPRGRWAFLEIRGPWNAQTEIRGFAAGLSGTPKEE